MKAKLIDFTLKPTLTIDGQNYSFNESFTIKTHPFNISQVYLKQVHIPSNLYDNLNKLVFPDTAVAELKFGNDVLIKGDVAIQGPQTFGFNKPNMVEIIITSLKTKISKGIYVDDDFNDITPEQLVDYIIDKYKDSLYKGNLNFKVNKIIPHYGAYEKHPYNVFRELETITQSILRLSWDTVQAKYEVSYLPQDKTLTPTKSYNLKIVEDRLKFFNDNNIVAFDFKKNISSRLGTRRTRGQGIRTSKPIRAYIPLLNKTSPTFKLKAKVSHIDALNTLILNSDKSELRIAQASSEAGNTVDVIYNIGSSSIEINTTLIGKNKYLQFTYYPLIDLDIDFISDNSTDRMALKVIDKVNNAEEMLRLGSGLIAKDQLDTGKIYVSSLNKILWDYTDTIQIEMGNLLDGLYTAETINIRRLVNDVFIDYVLTKRFNMNTNINWYDNIPIDNKLTDDNKSLTQDTIETGKLVELEYTVTVDATSNATGIAVEF